MADADVSAFVKKSASEMRAAQSNYDSGEYDPAAASAYYSALHMAKAVLHSFIELGRPVPQSHGAVRKVIEDRLSDKKDLGEEAFLLGSLYRARHIAHYDADPISAERAEYCLRQSRRFRDAASDFIARQRDRGRGR